MNLIHYRKEMELSNTCIKEITQISTPVLIYQSFSPCSIGGIQKNPKQKKKKRKVFTSRCSYNLTVRGVFRTLSNNYDEALFSNLFFFTRKAPLWTFDRVPSRQLRAQS